MESKFMRTMSMALGLALFLGFLAVSPAEGVSQTCSTRILASNYKVASNVKYIFIGLRGSGESLSDSQGFGAPVKGLYDTLIATTPYRNMICSTGPTLYQAYSVPDGTNSGAWNQYISSIYSVSGVLKNSVANLMKHNPKVKILLAGYSQGAAIAHLTVSALSSNSTYAKRISLITIADPLASASDRRVSGVDANWTTPSSDGILTIAIKHPELARSQYNGVIQALGLDNGLGAWASGIPVIVNTVTSNKSSISLVSDQDLMVKGVRVYPVCETGDAVCAPAPAGFFDNLNLIPQKVNAGALNGTWFNVGIHTSAYSGANTLWASNILKDLITNKF